jgi:hypothetical protein
MRKLLTILPILLYSCAQIIAPTGGQVDKTPPELVHSIPESKTRNYVGREFKLTFSELIDASALNSELVIVPDPGSPYETKVKNNELSIKFDKPLAENTTYTFNFRNGIKDLTEKNAAKNLKLVISTGPDLDSLQIEGKIINLYTKEPTLDATVGLYPYDTLDLNKKKPLYFVKTDSSGRYQFENIKSNTYFLMAFTDKNNNLRYDPKDELLGFNKDSVILTQNSIQNDIEIYKSNYSRNRIRRAISREDDFTLQLDKPVKQALILFENLKDSNAISYKTKGTELKIYKLDESIKDTLYSTVILQDSLLFSDTLQQKIYFKEERNRRQKINILNINSLTKNQQEITENHEYIFQFDTPIKRANIEKIQMKIDTVSASKIEIKTIDNQTLSITSPPTAKREIEIQIPSNIFENYQGDTNALFLLKNPILKDEQLGLLEGETNDKTLTKIAILQDENRTKTISTHTFKERFLFENIIPGTYHITIIMDENENGIWDPGKIEDLSTPEKIVTTKEPIRVRANYEFRTLKLE